MKLLKLGMSLLLVCTMLVGCSKKGFTEEEMKALLQDAQTNTLEATSGKMGIDMDLELNSESLGKQPIKLKMQGEVVYKDLLNENRGLAANLKTSMLGIEIPMDFYIKDHVLYMNALGMKTKTPMPLVDFDADANMVNMDLSMLKNFKYDKLDGNDVITCDLDEMYLKKAIDEEAIKINTMKCTYTIARDQHFSSMRVDMDFAVDINDTNQIGYKGYFVVNYEDINKVSDINYPDFSDYIESLDDNLNLDDLLE